MKVSDILRVKGGTLFTVSPGESLSAALDVMSEQDIGSLVVMDHGELVGMLTFREVIQAIVKNGGALGDTPGAGRDGRPPAHLHAGDRDRRGAPHDARPPCALHCR